MKKAIAYTAILVGILALAYTHWINIFTSRPCGMSTLRSDVLSGQKEKGSTPFLTQDEVDHLPEPSRKQYTEATRHASGLAQQLRTMIYLSYILSAMILILAVRLLAERRLKETNNHKEGTAE